MSKNTVIISIAIILGCIILGGFYFAVQTSKLASIERQQETELSNKKQSKVEGKKELESCIETANKKIEKMRDDYCKLDNRRIEEDGSCFLSRERVDYLNERRNTESDVCFKMYPQ